MEGRRHGRFDDLVQANRPRVVLSSHDFTGVPADLCTRAGAMRATGAAVIKVAVTAARLSDTLPLRELAKHGDAVVIGMGDAGVPTPPAGDAVRVPMDLRRQRRCARSDSCGANG